MATLAWQIAFLIIAYLVGNAKFAEYLGIPHILGVGDLTVRRTGADAPLVLSGIEASVRYAPRSWTVPLRLARSGTESGLQANSSAPRP